jgi:glycosyltransferase involved in cell wall biosynthesis
LDGISFIVTIFDKRFYLPRVLHALARQTGPFRREFIFVDDGSSDGSAELICELTRDWKERVIVLRQANRGASAATNSGAARASFNWLKLVDGDDLLVPEATVWLFAAAQTNGHSLAYGDLEFYDPRDPDPLTREFPQPIAVTEEDGLARFIRNCPANSSSILVSTARYWEAGGCDERLVSPDQALFLRLFLVGGGVHLRGPVALVPNTAPGRLSDQRARSRYEAVLALYYLLTDNPDIGHFHSRLAYRRALSRAYRFHREYKGHRVFSGHFLRLLLSRLPLALDRAAAVYKALGAFTEDGRSERPTQWLPGALRKIEAAAPAVNLWPGCQPDRHSL